MNRMLTWTATLLLYALPARADGTLEVRIIDWAGRPMDGSVRLAGPKAATCASVAGRCTVSLPPGTYKASLAPRGGKAPPEKSVSVAATGTTKLVLAALAPEPAAAAPPAEKSAAAPDAHDAVRAKPPGKNLAQGKKMVVDGRILDAAGRPCDALLVLLRAGEKTPLGHVRSVAGRFSVLDLAPGTYTVRAYARGGGAPSVHTVKVAKQAGKAVLKLP